MGKRRAHVIQTEEAYEIGLLARNMYKINTSVWGNSFWKKIEGTGKLSGSRTWQTLRNFARNVSKGISRYNWEDLFTGLPRQGETNCTKLYMEQRPNINCEAWTSAQLRKAVDAMLSEGEWRFYDDDFWKIVVSRYDLRVNHNKLKQWFSNFDEDAYIAVCVPPEKINLIREMFLRTSNQTGSQVLQNCNKSPHDANLQEGRLNCSDRNVTSAAISRSPMRICRNSPKQTEETISENQNTNNLPIVNNASLTVEHRKRKRVRSPSVCPIQAGLQHSVQRKKSRISTDCCANSTDSLKVVNQNNYENTQRSTVVTSAANKNTKSKSEDNYDILAISRNVTDVWKKLMEYKTSNDKTYRILQLNYKITACCILNSVPGIQVNYATDDDDVILQHILECLKSLNEDDKPEANSATGLVRLLSIGHNSDKIIGMALAKTQQ